MIHLQINVNVYITVYICLESGTDGCNRQPGRSTQICEITWDLASLECQNLVHYEYKHTVIQLDKE